MIFDIKYWFSSFNMLLFAEVQAFLRLRAEACDGVTFLIGCAFKNNETTLS